MRGVHEFPRTSGRHLRLLRFLLFLPHHRLFAETTRLPRRNFQNKIHLDLTTWLSWLDRLAQRLPSAFPHKQIDFFLVAALQLGGAVQGLHEV